MRVAHTENPPAHRDTSRCCLDAAVKKATNKRKTVAGTQSLLAGHSRRALGQRYWAVGATVSWLRERLGARSAAARGARRPWPMYTPYRYQCITFDYGTRYGGQVLIATHTSCNRPAASLSLLFPSRLWLLVITIAAF